MSHCGLGILSHGSLGPWPQSGADFNAVINWVEKGIAPSEVIGSGNTAAPAFIPGSPTTLTRPLCPYPQTAVYNGSGSVTDAANWHCGGDLEKNIPVGTPLSGPPGQPVPCYDVLVKYKHEVNGPLDYEGSGVNPAMCQRHDVTLTPDIDENLTSGDGYRTVAISQRKKRQQACAAMRTPLFCTQSARRMTGSKGASRAALSESHLRKSQDRFTGTVKTRELLLMTYRTASVAAKTIVFSTPAMVALALTVGPHAFAQQPSTNPPVRRRKAPESWTGAAGSAGRDSAERPAAGAADFFALDQILRQGPDGKSSEIRAKEVCFTASDGHLTSGQKLVIALLIEPEGGDTKLLRVTLPLGVALVPGARIVIDEKEAMTAPYVVCLPKNGCMADYKADADLIEKLKKGRSLAIQAFEKGRPISFTLPLTGFAKAYDGPASDPTGLNERQEGLPNELQKSLRGSDTPDGK